MKRVEIDLDEDVYEAARRMAQERNSPFKQMLEDIIGTQVRGHVANPIIGLFSSDAKLLDDVCESAMVSRERDPLRV